MRAFLIAENHLGSIWLSIVTGGGKDGTGTQPPQLMLTLTNS